VSPLQKLMSNVSFEELKAIYKEAQEVFDSSISWEAKFPLIGVTLTPHTVTM